MARSLNINHFDTQRLKKVDYFFIFIWFCYPGHHDLVILLWALRTITVEHVIPVFTTSCLHACTLLMTIQMNMNESERPG